MGLTNRPARDLGRAVPEEARMNERAPDLTQQVLHPAMQQKLLLRAAELVARPRGQRLRYSAVSLGGPARAPAAARTRAGPPRPGALE